MQRQIFLIIAVGLLIGAVALNLFLPDKELWLAFCWRTGAVFAAVWLAYDDIQRLPNWLLLTLPLLIIVLARWPKFIPAVVALLIGWAILKRFLVPGNTR